MGTPKGNGLVEITGENKAMDKGWFLHIDDEWYQTAIAIPIKCLHELQNAYFVATKKELEVKL